MKKHTKKTKSAIQRNLIIFIVFEFLIIALLLAGKSLSTQNNNSQIDSSTQTPIVEANDSNSPSNYKAVTTVTPEIASPGQKVVIETKVTSEIAQQVFLELTTLS
jgi:hypothetical protein